jgi:lipopolysaccharide/colanic/teichoic acid biosynthesis glycosyltransferase
MLSIEVMSPPRNDFYSRILKPAIDHAMAAVGLVLCAPILLIIMVFVRMKLGRPVLFWQQRPGLHGRPFWMPKFRTMTNDCDSAGEPLPDEKRLTRFGRWLRSSSLDELPELWCVLRGEMSLVGPRPLLLDYVSLYTPRQAMRHEAKPGITGLAQVRGRNALDWPERLEIDACYVENSSMFLDLKILLSTFNCVLFRRGINSDSHATMPPFTGQSVTLSSPDAA